MYRVLLRVDCNINVKVMVSSDHVRSRGITSQNRIP